VPAPDGHRFHPTLESAAALLAGSFPADGPVRVRPHPVTGDPDPVTGAPSLVDPVAPAGVHDLVANLRQVAALSDAADSDHNGTVAVQTITTEAGRRHVVYLPGTDDLTTRPWSQDDDLRDGHTNLEAVSGIPTSYAEGVREAMRQAGVAPGEPVLLVGHSQGGMVAGEVARHPGDFAVTDVVTAGAPIGGQPPPEVRVLSLENTGDVVPLVDGAPNGQDAHHVTVRFDGRQGTVLGDHDYPAYELGARAVDASADPSVRDAVDGLSGFLGADDPGEVRVFRLTRGG
jgi:hypothetical protein